MDPKVSWKVPKFLKRSVVVSLTMDPKAHIFEHLVTKQWSSLEGLEGLGGVAFWRKYITGGKLWGFKSPCQDHSVSGYGSGCSFQILLQRQECHHTPAMMVNDRVNLWYHKQPPSYMSSSKSVVVVIVSLKTVILWPRKLILYIIHIWRCRRRG